MVPLAVAAGCLGACAPASDPPGGTAPTTPVTPPPAPLTGTPVLQRTVVLTGLSSPWDVAVTPDGAVVYTERCRGVSLRRPDGATVRLFGTAGSTLVAPDLVCEGQSGVLGVALDPAFATTRRLYVFLASGTASTSRSNHVARLTLSPDLARVTARDDILTAIPYKQAANAVGGAGMHSGGRLRFGPDGFLYVATGDNHDGVLPQHPTRLGGKVLRVDADGAAAPGNNAPPGFDPRIFTFGHRNVQGLAFHPASRAVYAAEHGPNHSDEVTRLAAGGNAGWDPANRPSLSCPGGYCGYAGSATTMPMTDRTRFPQAMPAAWSNEGRSEGMGPAEFLAGAAWRDWNGRLAVGMMRAQRLLVLALGADGQVTGSVAADLPAARYRGLTLGRDGALWVVTDAGELWRVEPVAP
jgi:glucose/arabinose dehydrogenase